jgi:hypothetical protein
MKLLSLFGCCATNGAKSHMKRRVNNTGFLGLIVRANGRHFTPNAFSACMGQPSI